MDDPSGGLSVLVLPSSVVETGQSKPLSERSTVVDEGYGTGPLSRQHTTGQQTELVEGGKAEGTFESDTGESEVKEEQVAKWKKKGASSTGVESKPSQLLPSLLHSHDAEVPSDTLSVAAVPPDHDEKLDTGPPERDKGSPHFPPTVPSSDDSTYEYVGLVNTGKLGVSMQDAARLVPGSMFVGDSRDEHLTDATLPTVYNVGGQVCEPLESIDPHEQDTLYQRPDCKSFTGLV